MIFTEPYGFYSITYRSTCILLGMKIIMHGSIAEIVSTDTLVKNGADMLQLCMDVHHSQGVRAIVLQQHHISPEFF
jgi:hypothetical protein